MDFGKTFDMLHWKTLLEKWTSIGLNVSAATWVKKTPNTFLKEKKKPTQKTKPHQTKSKQKNHPQPPPKTKLKKQPTKKPNPNQKTTTTKTKQKNPSKKKIPENKTKQKRWKNPTQNPPKKHYESWEIKRNVTQNWTVAGSHPALFWWLLVICKMGC